MGFQQADFSQLHSAGYGIGFHWTSLTHPREGKPLSYREAVEAFDVDAFVKQAIETGAGYVAHFARVYLPARFDHGDRRRVSCGGH